MPASKFYKNPGQFNCKVIEREAAGLWKAEGLYTKKDYVVARRKVGNKYTGSKWEIDPVPFGNVEPYGSLRKALAEIFWMENTAKEVQAGSPSHCAYIKVEDCPATKGLQKIAVDRQEEIRRLHVCIANFEKFRDRMYLVFPKASNFEQALAAARKSVKNNKELQEWKESAMRFRDKLGEILPSAPGYKEILEQIIELKTSHEVAGLEAELLESRKFKLDMRVLFEKHESKDILSAAKESSEAKSVLEEIDGLLEHQHMDTTAQNVEYILCDIKGRNKKVSELGLIISTLNKEIDEEKSLRAETQMNLDEYDDENQLLKTKISSLEARLEDTEKALTYHRGYADGLLKKELPESL